jgi:hypothetical protein
MATETQTSSNDVWLWVGVPVIAGIVIAVVMSLPHSSRHQSTILEAASVDGLFHFRFDPKQTCVSNRIEGIYIVSAFLTCYGMRS